MDIILDTNVVAWLLGTGGRRINAPALHTLSDPRNRLWVSSASAYELINKVRLGKWPQAELIALEWSDKLVELDARPLSLEAQDMIAAASLIWEHRDPLRPHDLGSGHASGAGRWRVRIMFQGSSRNRAYRVLMTV